MTFSTLVAPPAHETHSPIPSNRIVLARDSVGASLCLAAVKTILCLRHEQQYILFNGNYILLELPSGVFCLSLGIDATMSLPSRKRNLGIDYMTGKGPYLQADFPTDSN